MAFRIGNDKYDIYAIKGGSNTNYRGVYWGKEHLWPEYRFEPKNETFNHKSEEGSLNNIELVNVPYNTEDGLKLDPSGGTFTLQIYDNESSNWHHMPFKILIGKECELISVKENDQELPDCVIAYPEEIIYDGVYETYPAYIWTVYTNASGEETNETLNRFEETGLTLEFKIEANQDSDFTHDIVLWDFMNEFGAWNQIKEKKLVTLYSQASDIKYDTIASWVDGPNSTFVPTKSPVNLEWNQLVGTAYLAIAFGISKDGKTWYWGPANDHTVNNFISLNGGNTLNNISQYFTLDIPYTDTWGSTLNITFGDQLASSNYYVIPVTIEAKNVNNAENNPNKSSIDYRWNPENNPKTFIPQKVNASGNETSSRTLTGVQRSEGTSDRKSTIKLSFSYKKHSFKIG